MRVRNGALTLALLLFLSLSFPVTGLALDGLSEESSETFFEELPEEPSNEPFEEPPGEPPEELPDELLTEETDTVFNEQELSDRLDAYAKTGGTVTLGGVVEITNTISVYGGSAEAPLIIDAGRFGLVYNGGVISAGFLEITGEGDVYPVLEIKDAGYFWIGNWNNDLIYSSVTATGKDGLGGTAVCISSDPGGSFSMGSVIYGEPGRIRSFGTGAVGVSLAVPLELYCLNVEVSGDGSTAVSAPLGASLYYCKISSEGENAVSVDGGGLVLDTCNVQPEPQNARVICRRFTDVTGKRFYFPVEQGEMAMLFEVTYTFWLSGNDEFPPVTQSFVVEWELFDEDWSPKISTDETGRQPVPGKLFPVFQGLGLEGDFPLTLIVDVRDPTIPCVSEIGFTEWIDTHFASLMFWDSYEPGELILWRSDDGGETWYDYTDGPDVEWLGYGLNFYYGELTSEIMFQLELPGVGESNVVTIYMADGQPYGDTGGDRTGGDRKGAEKGGDPAPDDDTVIGEPDITDTIPPEDIPLAELPPDMAEPHLPEPTIGNSPIRIISSAKISAEYQEGTAILEFNNETVAPKPNGGTNNAFVQAQSPAAEGVVPPSSRAEAFDGDVASAVAGIAALFFALVILGARLRLRRP